ncbi:ENTH domain-containing protein 1 isoform X2 [Pogona vitticeps]
MALRRHVKNFVKNYSEAEIKVREATSNDPWGPSSSLMLDISDLTYNAVSLSEIMNMIWHRMNDHGKNWRHVYKSLTLLDYLLKNGSKKVIQLCQEGFFNIHVLKDFHHLDDAGKDQDFVPKALPATEQSQPEQTPSKTEVVQETPALNIAAKNSSEDLIVFSEDESSPTAAQSTFSSKGSKEESETSTKAPVCNILNARCALTPSERNSLPQQKWDSGRKSKSSVLSIDMLKSPPRRRSSVHTHTVAATLYGVWSSNPEESVTTSKQLTPKLDLVCGHAAASVETIYKSPTFQAFDPLGDNVTNPTKSASTSEQFCEPTKASLQNLHYLIPADLSGHPAPRPDSTSSVGTTSSLSTFSTSSPESAVPNNTSQPHHVHPKWFAYLSPGQEPSSPFFKELKERIMHSFSPASAYEVDACASILSLLPDNSKCSVKNIDGLGSRTCRALGESWENNIVHNASSVPNPVTPSITKPLGEELVYMSAEQKGMAMLEEIKNTVCGLRGDFCSVARELHIIRTELTNMVASIQNIDKFFAALQSGKGDSDHL